MRILHIGKFFSPFAGGIENFLADLMLAQSEQGHTVAALVHDHQMHYKRFFAKINPETAFLPTFSLYRAPSYGRLLYAPISPHFPLWFQRILQTFQPQILHLHLPNTSALWALWLTAARRVPWVIHWHADVVSQVDQRLTWAYRGYRPFEQHLLAHAAAIIATSPPYLTSSEALSPWRAKCHVVPLGLAPARLPTPSPQGHTWAAQQWDTGMMKILSVGRLTYYKGHEILIQALAHIDGVQVVIVGDGDQRQRLEKLIKSLNLSKKVKLYGHCHETELNALLATCDCFCLPSLERTEAFGLVLLEAMRYAKPIIASRIDGSGVAWVIDDHRTGILVPPQEPLALAAALQQFSTRPDWRWHLGQAGYTRFKESFNIQPVSTKITAIYTQILNSLVG